MGVLLAGMVTGSLPPAPLHCLSGVERGAREGYLLASSAELSVLFVRLRFMGLTVGRRRLVHRRRYISKIMYICLLRVVDRVVGPVALVASGWRACAAAHFFAFFPTGRHAARGMTSTAASLHAQCCTYHVQVQPCASATLRRLPIH